MAAPELSQRLGYLEAAVCADENSLQSTLKLDLDESTSQENANARRHITPRRSLPRPGSGNSVQSGGRSSSQSRRRSSKEASELSVTRERSASKGRKTEPSSVPRRALSREASFRSDGGGDNGGTATIQEKLTPSPPQSPPLEWTKRPNRQITREGSSVCQVSTPASNASAREHKPYLVRTTRIEPVSPGTNGRPPVPGKRQEKIVVTEKDLQRCGGDLKKLRECNIPPTEYEKTASPPSKLELSFKSAFDLRCREGADLRDPWRDCGHPDEDRQLNVEDLILNQVWVGALSPRKIEHEDGEEDTSTAKDSARSRKDGSISPQQEQRSDGASTRASSADAVALQTMTPSEAARYDRKMGTRRNSMRNLPPQMANVTQLPTVTRSRSSRSRETSKRSTSAGPGDKPLHNKPRAMRFASPIKCLDDDVVDQMDQRPREVCETPPNKRAAAKFLAGAGSRGETRAVWMALDMETGEIEVYQREVGARLEAAFISGRNSVPLAGLGEGFDGAIVTFGSKYSKGVPKLRKVDASEHEVRRFEVTAYSYEMTVRVAWPGKDSDFFRFADSDQERGEDRLLCLFGTELVAPPSPTLPPVDRARQCHFINPGADWAEHGYNY